eukprot:RCo038827
MTPLMWTRGRAFPMMAFLRFGGVRTASSSSSSSSTSTSASGTVSKPVVIAPGVRYTECGRRTGSMVILSGWTGAKPSQYKKYLEFYHERGFDSIDYAVTPKHILQPDLAVKHMRFVLDRVAQSIRDKTHHSVVYHGFSVSGYLFGLALIAMNSDPEHFGTARSGLKAQIFDSPPDYDHIAFGLGKMLETDDFRETIVQKFAEIYLWATYNSAGVHHRASSKAFWNNNLMAPALWFYSKADEVAPWKVCRDCAAGWRKNGIEVDEVIFDTSKHIQHMRMDPESYVGGLDDFLKKHGLMPQLSK